MKVTIIFALLAFLFTACTTPINVNRDNVVIGQLKASAKGPQFGTLTPKTFRALGLKGEYTVIGAVSEGELVFLGLDGKRFKLSDEQPRGKLVRDIRIRTYVNSPDCQLIEPGDGTSFWYPEGCP